MPSEIDPINKTLENISLSIDRTQHLPHNVFLRDWCRFFFFDSDWIFDRAFVKQLQRILNAEGSVCACLIDLDILVSAKEFAFVIDRHTDDASYLAVLNGKITGEGWIYSMSRFACASDLGRWCIYCERQSEIAVFALKHDAPIAQYDLFISSVRALPIAQAIDNATSYAFSRALLPEWKSELLQNY